MRVFISLIISICILSYGCISTPNLEKDCEISRDEAITLETRASVVDSAYFRILPDPYSLQNMQSVYDKYSLDNPVTLQPTDWYVRFLPQTKEDLDLLESIEDLDLSPIPLDAEIEDENAYLDSLGGEDKFHWLYTTVPVDFVFPPGVQYEVIRECYIPLDGETIVNTRAGEIDVEAMAYAELEYELEIDTNASGSNYPRGFVRVDTSFEENPIGVEGVKVVCHTFTKRAKAYTDEQGYYIMNKEFKKNPRYRVVFENNTNDFTIWGNYAFLAPAQQCLGKHSKNGYNVTFVNGDKGWKWSAINNAACDYYRFCEENGIVAPPKNLKIWAIDFLNVSSAPMLRRVWTIIPTTWGDGWFEKFLNGAYAVTISYLNLKYKICLPDIIVGTENNDYDIISRTSFHELAHASHFSKVGQNYWVKYIAYIMTCFGYGDGSEKNAELCAIGEMWGYSMAYLYHSKEFPSERDITYLDLGESGWIKPRIFCNLVEQLQIKEGVIFSCMTESVDTYDELISKLISKNQDIADEIVDMFAEYGIGENSVNRQICDQIYDEPSIEYGYSVEASNVYVESGSSLTILFKDRVTISDHFCVDANAKFELHEIE